ncbi:hypothetical protein [Methanobrevibacter sp.]|uniref:hypothetical protein n=1 Tax=Methanobrevibacter sp. TaxID=66852 RepID=UPI00388F802D
MEFIGKVNDIKSYFIVSILCLLSIFRVYVGNSFPYWYLLTNQLDELLLINNAHLGQYFANWNIHSLSKTIAYSLFLKFVNVTGLPYGVVLSLVWILAGIFVVYAVYNSITKNKIFLALIYLFIIFLPTGLDLFISGRIYRNAIIAPFLILFLSSLFIFMNKVIFDDLKQYSLLIWGIILGLLFTFNYYIKEDGIGILILFLAGILITLIFKLADYFKSNKFDVRTSGKMIVLCLIPILIFIGGTFAYSEINHEKFGVYDINTRTEGELGEFFHNLLLIEDDNKSDVLWVPYSTIEKAWNASPTLQSRPDLLDNWTHSGWAEGDLKKNNLTGDTIAWSLRDALSSSGLYNDEKSTSDFFHTVNNELSDAFENGNLNKSDKIFISKYAIGRSLDEIYSLKDLFFPLLQTSTLYNDLGRTIQECNVDVMYPTLTYGERSDVSEIESFLNMHILTKDEFSQDDFTLKLAGLDIQLYQVISIVLVIISVIGFIFTGLNVIMSRFKQKSMLLLFIFEILLLATFFVQLFGLCWFCSFLYYCEYTIAYSSNCQAIFALFEVLSISGLFVLLKEKYFE